MRNIIFREALNHGEGYKFTYKGMKYEVIDTIIIYGVDEDWTWVKYVDF